MTTSIELGIVVGMFLGLMAVLCAIASLTLRRNGALAWTAVSLVLTALTTVLSTLGNDAGYVTPLEAVMEPLAFLLAGQTVYALMPELGHRGRTIIVVAVLSALSVALYGLNVPFIYRAAAFELACFVAMTDALVRVAHHISAGRLQTVLAGATTPLWLVTLGRMIALPFIDGMALTPLSFVQSWAHTAFAIGGSLLAPLIIGLVLWWVISDTISLYQHQSERDGLTGLFNRRAIDAMTAQTGQGGAVIFCDIDHFKRVNDRFGHEAGDRVICSFAALLADTGHIAGRIGGEEFALLLPGQSANEAAVVAENIRICFHQIDHETLPGDERLSASFGVALHRADEPARQAFARADAALYDAKTTGRNRVIIHNIIDHAPKTRFNGGWRAA